MTFAHVRGTPRTTGQRPGRARRRARRPRRDPAAPGPETAIAHVAAYRSGLIAVPLFVLFGPDAHRVPARRFGRRGRSSPTAQTGRRSPRSANGCRTSRRSWSSTAAASTGRSTTQATARRGARASRRWPRPPTTRRSSSTPRARPVHRRARCTRTASCSAICPGVLLPQEFPPQPGDLFWTPADWAWIGGLYDVLFPAWHWGIPVLAHRARQFDPERALDLMARHGVRNVFLPPTALKLIRRSGARRAGGPAPAVGRQRWRDARERSCSSGAARRSA